MIRIKDTGFLDVSALEEGDTHAELQSEVEKLMFETRLKILDLNSKARTLENKLSALESIYHFSWDMFTKTDKGLVWTAEQEKRNSTKEAAE